MNGISTEYFHLSRFAEGLKKGDRVRQKQLIGYVGSTGLSTGPHLHFGMLRSGGHVDPSKQKFPNAKPLPNEYRAEFDAVFEPLRAQLESLTRS
jgi:murein DD-endopeptidase MepM/ murein hydrolase activator NlpD